MSEIDASQFHLHQLQRTQKQPDQLDIRFDAGMPIQLGTQLYRFPCGIETGRQSVDDGSAVTKPDDTRSIEQMRINARDLRGDVCTQPHRAPGQLINQLEGPQGQVRT